MQRYVSIMWIDYIETNEMLLQSYHDLAVRLEPIILELEREQNDLLIIAHESVLRVLYGYLMACNATDIPFLSFPRNEIIEVCSRLTIIFSISLLIICSGYSGQLPERSSKDTHPELTRGDNLSISGGHKDTRTTQWLYNTEGGLGQPCYRFFDTSERIQNTSGA